MEYPNVHPIFSEEYVFQDLVSTYNKHGRIIVAYDFDNTVYTKKPELKEFCNAVCRLLKDCSKYPNDITMVCFTCRTGEELVNTVIPFLEENNITHDIINRQVNGLPDDMYSTLSCKVLYNIFLDDHCGILFTYKVLNQFVQWLKVQKMLRPR